MKQSLTLKVGQQLTMTPQLQQAIRLLQLSALDLKAEIQENIDANPMLELDDDEPVPEIDQPDPPTAAAVDDVTDDAPNDAQMSDTDPIPDDLPVDSQWTDIYPSGGGDPDGDWDPDRRNATDDTLHDHLRWQLNLTPMSDVDRAIAEAIIDGIDADGMLTVPLDDILAGFDAEDGLEEDEVRAVLRRVQQFDPPGVAARDLAECLALQLNNLPPDTAHREAAIQLVTCHLELLAARDFTTLERKTKLDEPILAEVVALIQSLNPRPGSIIATGTSDYVIPDVIVRKTNGRWQVELNSEALPRIRVNDGYASLVRKTNNATDSAYLKNNLQEARWLIKSLQSRNDTLLRVATKIVELQRGFLEYGEEAMKPMVLADIAEAVDMHESTISRVTSRKYMHTPRGIYELKYFFSSHVSTNSGGEVSSTAIRALIKKLTAEENPRKPLSDNKIAAILADQNIKVARRTVAKYRESMMIPPSNERKRLV